MDVTVATVFDAARVVVAATAGDLDQAARWFSNVRSVRWHGETGPTPGARVDLVSRFLGRELIYPYRIVEFTPEERLVMRTDAGPYPLETTFAWWDEEPGELGPRTGMSLRNVGRPHAMTTLASGAVTLGMRRAMRRDLERLRAALRADIP